MVEWLRNWLLGIVKQAIREYGLEHGASFPVKTIASIRDADATGSASIPLEMDLSNAPRYGGILRSHPDAKRAVPRYQYPSVEPQTFEEEQDQALKAQDAFWASQVKSDV
jgi:hypothetical protein